jgi:ribosomal subunit interface protein
MQDQLQITFHGIDHSDAIESRIREKVARLERFAQHTTSLRVTVDAPHQQHTKGTLYSVRIDARLRNSELAVSRAHRHDHSHEDVYAAIRDAFDALERQLEDHVRQQRGTVKRHDVPDHGKVIKLFPQDGYGFAESADGMEVYFHENAVSGSFASLNVGDEVRLVIAEDESERGPQASTVTPIGKHHVTA